MPAEREGRRAVNIRDYVAQVEDQAPPMTDEQHRKLAALLAPKPEGDVHVR